MSHSEFDPKEILPQKQHNLIFRYAWEYAKWALDGFCYRTHDEVTQIYDHHCSQCVYLDNRGSDEESCGICGCPINTFLIKANKLAYRTTFCQHSKKPVWFASRQLPWFIKLLLPKRAIDRNGPFKR